MPARSRPAWTSETVASTRNEVQVGDARDDVAAANQRAFLRQHPRQDAVAIRLRRRQLEQPPRLRRFLVERAALERRAPRAARSSTRSAFFRSSRSCASSICACLTASSERRSASRESRPSLNSCRSPASCACADCSSSVLTSIRPSRSTSDFSSVSRVCACWFSLILQVLDELVERQHRFADVELDDRVAALRVGARPLQDPQHARVERAREHALDLGDDRARRHDDRVDRAGRDAGRADARAAHRRPQPAGQPDDEQRHNQERDGDLERPAGDDPGVELPEQERDPREPYSSRAVPCWARRCNDLRSARREKSFETARRRVQK